MLGFFLLPPLLRFHPHRTLGPGERRFLLFPLPFHPPHHQALVLRRCCCCPFFDLGTAQAPMEGRPWRRKNQKVGLGWQRIGYLPLRRCSRPGRDHLTLLLRFLPLLMENHTHRHRCRRRRDKKKKNNNNNNNNVTGQHPPKRRPLCREVFPLHHQPFLLPKTKQKPPPPSRRRKRLDKTRRSTPPLQR